MSSTAEWEKQEREFFNPHLKQNNLRNCNLCSHQGICSAFANFKLHVEPMLLDQKTTLKAENLAWICNLYVEKERK